MRAASPVADLSSLGLFRNPYDDTNNPVGGIRDILPIQRNDEVEDGVDGTIVATNDYDGDWNRMDSVVGYEVANSNHHDYGHHPHHGQYINVPYQAEASTTNLVAKVLPETKSNTAQVQGHKDRNEENIGL